MKLSNPPLIVYMTQPAPTQIPTRLKVIVLLGFRLDGAKQATKATFAAEETATQFNVHRLIDIDRLGQIFTALHQTERVRRDDDLLLLRAPLQLRAQLVLQIRQQRVAKGARS